MAQDKNKSWLLLPTLNEEENLKWLLPLLTPQYEVIVIDNGSTDSSLKVAQQFSVHTIHASPKGYGRAVISGYEHALQLGAEDNDIIMVFDADGTSPHDKIPDLVRSLEKNDFVIAQRQSADQGALPLHAKLGNWLVTWMVWFMTGYKYRDMGPMRAMRCKCFKEIALEDQTWGINVEWQIKAQILGLKTIEIDIHYKNRVFGKSKISGSVVGSLKAATKMLYATIIYGFKARRIIISKR